MGVLNGPVPSGTTIGRWTVVGAADTRNGLRYLRCRCECGTERDVFIGNLRIGTSKSCGHDLGSQVRTHGLSAAPEYRVWLEMIARCHNQKNRHYGNYGGRGIHVCERWRASFSDFISDIGRRPKRNLTIERIDNDGNYELGNVKWATRSDQMLNTRLTHAERVRRGRLNAMKRWHPELFATNSHL